MHTSLLCPYINIEIWQMYGWKWLREKNEVFFQEKAFNAFNVIVQKLENNVGTFKQIWNHFIQSYAIVVRNSNIKALGDSMII